MGKRAFKVIDNQTGTEIRNAFVLLPERDSAARTALATYAEATNKPVIARWIKGWLIDIHIKRTQRHDSEGEKKRVLPEKKISAGHSRSPKK